MRPTALGLWEPEKGIFVSFEYDGESLKGFGEGAEGIWCAVLKRTSLGPGLVVQRGRVSSRYTKVVGLFPAGAHIRINQ